MRHRDALDPEALRGHAIHFDGCAGMARNLCKEQLRRGGVELADLVDNIHRALCAWSDAWGNEAANSVTKLVMIEASEGGVVTRTFALLARAYYSPKFQL